MAENEGSEKPVGSSDEKIETAPEKEKITVKKAAKKRATKKVVKKRAAKKKAVTKKAAVTKTDANKSQESVREVAQVRAEPSERDEKTAVAEPVGGSEPSDVGASRTTAESPVATGPKELSREENGAMSVETSNTAPAPAGAGFMPKVILWVIIVLAAFMYVRSLAHKGQTVKQGESHPVSSVVSKTAAKTDSNVEEGKSALTKDADTTGESAAIEPSPVAKVGEVAIEKAVEPTPISSDPDSNTAESDASSQEVSETKDTSAPDLQQDAVVTADTEQNAVNETASESTSSEASALESAQNDPTEESEPAASVSAAVAADQVSEDKSTEVVQAPESEVAITQEIAPTVDKEQVADEAEPVAAVEAESPEETAAAPTVIDASQQTAAPVAAGSKTVTPQTDAPETTTSARQHRSFKELFGYARPEPPQRRQAYRTQEPFSPSGSGRQGYYPAPWQSNRGGGFGYPGQYGPYGGYPPVPNMPGWAPYQPYGSDGY